MSEAGLQQTVVIKHRALLQLMFLFWKAAVCVAQGCIYAAAAAEDSPCCSAGGNPELVSLGPLLAAWLPLRAG